MTTTPTERRLAITKGTWTAQNILRVTRMGRMPKVVGPDGKLIVEFMGGELDEVEDNALLIADAGTTFNACGLTPSELLAKVREAEKENERLVEACHRMAAMLVTDDDLGPRRELAETDDFADPMNGGFSDESDPTLNLPQ